MNTNFLDSAEWCGWSHQKLSGKTSAWKLSNENRTQNKLGTMNNTVARLEGNYIYSDITNNTPSAIYSPEYEPEDRLACFTFHYNMFGKTIGDQKLFQLLQNDDYLSDQNLLLKISGDQGQNWHQAYVKLNEVNSRYQLVFQANQEVSSLSSVALDKFSLSQDETNCQLLKEAIRAKYTVVDHSKYSITK